MYPKGMESKSTPVRKYPERGGGGEVWGGGGGGEGTEGEVGKVEGSTQEVESRRGERGEP